MRKEFGHISFGKPVQKNVVLCSATPIDYFVKEQIDTDTFRITNPLIMLLNQKRLDTTTEKILADWLDRNPRDIDDAKIDTNDILESVKPRYVQSPSELKTWLQYLDKQDTTIRDSVRKKIDDYKAVKLAEQNAKLAQQQAQQQAQAVVSPKTE